MAIYKIKLLAPIYIIYLNIYVSYRRKKLDAQIANKEITEEQYQKQIEKTIITEDQYRKRLEALREKILLDQRRAGGIFAEDFRGGRQEARESRILGQQTQLEDFGAAFFD